MLFILHAFVVIVIVAVVFRMVFVPAFAPTFVQQSGLFDAVDALHCPETLNVTGEQDAFVRLQAADEVPADRRGK